jgi:hypothetical protein
MTQDNSQLEQTALPLPTFTKIRLSMSGFGGILLSVVLCIIMCQFLIEKLHFNDWLVYFLVIFMSPQPVWFSSILKQSGTFSRTNWILLGTMVSSLTVVGVLHVVWILDKSLQENHWSLLSIIWALLLLALLIVSSWATEIRNNLFDALKGEIIDPAKDTFGFWIIPMTLVAILEFALSFVILYLTVPNQDYLFLATVPPLDSLQVWTERLSWPAALLANVFNLIAIWGIEK